MKKRIFYGSMVVVVILFLIYSVILIKRGMLLDTHSSLITELYETVHPSSEVIVLNELYQEDGFTNTYILAVGAKNNLKDKQRESISDTDLENSIHEVFGNDISFKHEDFYLFANGICGYTYNKDTKTYEQIMGCSGSTNDAYVTKIIEASRLGKRLTIKEAVLYISKKEKTSIYTSSNQKNLIAQVENDAFYEEDYFDKGSIYEYTFEVINKKYILKEINLIK